MCEGKSMSMGHENFGLNSIFAKSFFMKKLFMLLLMFFWVGTIAAQKLYVEMEYRKNSIWLDDGFTKKPQVVKDADGKTLKFTSLIGALNYMSLQGWELFETKSVTSGAGYVGAYGGASSTGTTVYYLFYKQVSESELQDVVDKSYKED